MHQTVPAIENVRREAQWAAVLMERAIERLDRIAKHEEEPAFDEAAPFYGEYLLALTCLRNGAKAAGHAHEIASKYLHEPGGLLRDNQPALSPIKKP